MPRTKASPLTTYAVARRLNCSTRTVRRRIADGSLRAFLADTGRYYVRAEDVTLLEARRGRR
jgi:excisionase family DNA binding protein